MKHDLFKPLMAALLISISSSTYTFAAPVSQPVARVTLPATPLTTEQLISQIEAQSTYLFVYNEKEINLRQTVEVDAVNAPIDNVLKRAFQNTNITFAVEGANIILMSRQASGSGASSTQKVQQQDLVTVQGTIVDPQGMPIIGATVRVENDDTHAGISDLDGNFMLKAPKGATLVVSYIGYISQRIQYKGQNLKITLREDTKTLDEVVVVGFGSQKKVNLTGAVGTVDQDALQSRPVSSAADMLQGTVAGLNISTATGMGMGGTPSINIRGIATIGEGSKGNPLILIDGMEGDLSSVNPQDIDKVSVLKDATSSSIYGSRAPFGVILITTKSGKKGKTTINYNNSFRMKKPMNLPSQMNSIKFAHFYNDGQTNAGRAAWFKDDYIQRLKDYQAGIITAPSNPSPFDANFWGDGFAYGNANVDHYDMIYRDEAYSQEHNISIRGGNERINYFISGNYSNDRGFIKPAQERQERLTSTAKVEAQITSWAKVKVTNRFVKQNYHRPTNMDWNFFYGIAGWPTCPDIDANGNPYSSIPRQNGTPYFSLTNGARNTTRKKWQYQQYQLELEPIKNWKTFVDFNYKHTSTETNEDQRESFNVGVDNETLFPVNKISYVQEQRYSSDYINCNIYSQYNFTLEDKHNFKVMAGFQTEESKMNNVTAKRNGLVVPTLNTLNTTDGLSYEGDAVVPVVNGYYSDWATAGFFGRFNYDYEGRYLAEVNLRYDGTSRFQGSKRWGTFPSASLGWNIAREAFFEPYTDYVGSLKLRASYGELGNQNTSSLYPTYPVVPLNVQKGTWLINGGKPTTTREPNLIDPQLSWETIKNWNFGLDYSAFNNRLTGSFDYYIRDTKDMVGPAPELPDVFGATVPKQNNTDLRTTGWELIVSWRDRLENNLSYGVSLSLADSRTKITSYPNESQSLSTYIQDRYLGEIWGYETIGIAKSDEEMDAHLASLPKGGQSALGSKWAAGDIMYKDINGDGKVDGGGNTAKNPGDMKVIGNSTPRYMTSLTLDASWKGFDIRAFFQGVLKRDYWVSDSYFWGAYGSIWRSKALSPHLDYFRAEEDHPLGQNLDAYYPRPLFNWSQKNHKTQTRYLQDASYIRFKNLQLGYTLPADFTQQYGIQKCRAFISGENIMTFSDLCDIFDPETVDRGAAGSAYPLAQTWAVGINVTF